MKIERIETLACDAGWRNYHFLKLVTDDGVVGCPREIHERQGRRQGLYPVLGDIPGFRISTVGQRVRFVGRNPLRKFGTDIGWR